MLLKTIAHVPATCLMSQVKQATERLRDTMGAWRVQQCIILASTACTAFALICNIYIGLPDDVVTLYVYGTWLEMSALAAAWVALVLALGILIITASSLLRDFGYKTPSTRQSHVVCKHV